MIKELEALAEHRAVQFLDQSEEIRSHYDSDISRFESTPTGPDLSPDPITTYTGVENVHTPSSSVMSPTEGVTVLSALNSYFPTHSHIGRFPDPTFSQRPNPLVRPSDTQHLVYQQPPNTPVLWPLENEQEAMLLQHYIHHIALFFDMVDDKDHFSSHVVRCAKQNSTLMNAILALSARQLSRTSDFDAYVADAYYQRCFQTLIPALNDSTAIQEESLLAATIILRLMEEMNISIIGSDPQGHLFGAQAFIRAAERQYAGTTGPSFRQAIYWAAFRQELWISLMARRPFRLHVFPADRSLDPANDSTWATRTIAHLGDVCNFVFGEERHSVARYDQLMSENRAWCERRPDSFDPFFHRQDRDQSGRNFPDIRFHEKMHVMGKQYITLAHVLLVVHDPTIPQLGPSHKQSRQLIDEKVQKDVRTLCGVAQSNGKVFPCKFPACFAIALFGDRFTDRQDQHRLREMLIQTEAEHGFPPTATIHQLEEAWGWSGC
ncbi:hypothetical protein EJ04DRAFT_515198 [Polyplosphaeria fusca]|uniref:Uncharacterized protein n=1 Tax=Polyplosphaeria fusca TaxID=682080 RepID=A0A9P4UZ20_9PLEO|nr:hypothetical protein EJ04DRAFT_515198 [Polyplosphaeria fusca]